jgi:hypothetical protein
MNIKDRYRGRRVLQANTNAHVAKAIARQVRSVKTSDVYDPMPHNPKTSQKLHVRDNGRVMWSTPDLHVMPPLSAQGRTVKVLKSGVRRVSYR